MTVGGDTVGRVVGDGVGAEQEVRRDARTTDLSTKDTKDPKEERRELWCDERLGIRCMG
jgi:hypothetical protein